MRHLTDDGKRPFYRRIDNVLFGGLSVQTLDDDERWPRRRRRPSSSTKSTLPSPPLRRG
ncbi:hypothetical protein RDWZM_004620, partial [Blomia tropicalis]